MANAKRVYTHVSERAARGLERLSHGKAKVYAAPDGFTVVTEGRTSSASRKVIERREKMVRERTSG